MSRGGGGVGQPLPPPVQGIRQHWSDWSGLLLIGDDGPDVADEESHGPEGTADTPGKGCSGIESHLSLACYQLALP